MKELFCSSDSFIFARFEKEWRHFVLRPAKQASVSPGSPNRFPLPPEERRDPRRAFRKQRISIAVIESDSPELPPNDPAEASRR